MYTHPLVPMLTFSLAAITRRTASKDADCTASPSEDPSSPSDTSSPSGRSLVSPTTNATTAISRFHLYLFDRESLPTDSPNTHDFVDRCHPVDVHSMQLEVVPVLTLLPLIGTANKIATKAANRGHGAKTQEEELPRFADCAIARPLRSRSGVVPDCRPLERRVDK